MPYFADILILFGMLILCSTVFNYVSILIVSFTFQLNFQDVLHLVFDMEDRHQILALKVHNTITAVGTWLLTAVVFTRFKKWQLRVMVNWNPPKHRIVWMPVLAIFLSSIFISAYLLSISSHVQFFKDLDKQIGGGLGQDVLTKMLYMPGISDLLLNFFFIALVPAVLEEIFFRGVLQRLLQQATGSPHAGIIISSLLFAAVHLNPVQFIPMVFLAIVLGYVFYLTNSIFCSIAVHFFNNALAVSAYYFKDSSNVANEIVSDTYTPPLMLVVMFVVILIIAFYLLQNLKSKYQNE
jgi:membrane protease YdiL (CAAX protease family)